MVEAIPEAGATTAVAGLHHEADSDDAFVRPPWLERDQLTSLQIAPATTRYCITQDAARNGNFATGDGRPKTPRFANGDSNPKASDEKTPCPCRKLNLAGN